LLVAEGEEGQLITEPLVRLCFSHLAKPSGVFADLLELNGLP
jgi:hypothetical protein